MNLSSRDPIPWIPPPDPLKMMQREPGEGVPGCGGYVCVRTPDGKSLFGRQAAKCMDNLILQDFFSFCVFFRRSAGSVWVLLAVESVRLKQKWARGDKPEGSVSMNPRNQPTGRRTRAEIELLWPHILAALAGIKIAISNYVPAYRI